jgi:hypothetical protein
MSETLPVHFTDVLKARRNLRAYLRPTPLYTYPALNVMVGADVWVKHENHQPVGAFKVRSNAIQYRDKLSATYLNAHIVPYEDDRGRFYRVRIGRFSKLSHAIRFSKKLMDDGFERTFAVAE